MKGIKARYKINTRNTNTHILDIEISKLEDRNKLKLNKTDETEHDKLQITAEHHF